MSGILDQFFIQIGWDTKGLDRGQKDIDRKTKRVRDDAKKSADDSEAHVKRIGSTVRTVRNEVAGLFLAFAGANSLKGFLTEMVGGAAAAGRLADNLGISIEKLSGVRSAARAVGGSDADADTALSRLAGAFQNYKLLGNDAAGADFAGLGITPEDLENPLVALNKMAAAAERMSKPEFSMRLQRIGIPQSVINSLERGRKGYAELTAEGERNANLHKKDAEAAQQFDKSLNDLVTTIKGQVQPYLTQLVDGLNSFLKSGNDLNVLLPVATGLLVAFAAATLAAQWPWVALATAIGGATAAYMRWQGATTDQKKSLSEDAEDLRKQFEDADQRWDVPAMARIIAKGMGIGWDFYVNGKMKDGTPVGAGASPDVASQYNKLLKYGKPIADAIWHGIGAESQWNPNASLKDATGETYGLGQWRGPRLAALRRRYGNGKISASDQIDFLMSELEGGDRGGASVLNSGNYGDALSNYIGLSDGRNSFGFMRPGLKGRMGDLNRAAQYRGGRSGAQTIIHNTTSVGVINVASPDPARAGQDVHEKVAKRGLISQANTGLSQ